MLDYDGLPVSAELPCEHHVTRCNRAHRSARRRRDANPIPAQRRVVRADDAAEVVKDVAVHRPLQLAVIRRLDRACAASDGARLAAPAPACGLDGRDDVVEPGLAALDLGQPLLRLARVGLYAHQTLLALAFERLEPRLFLSLLQPVLLHVALQAHQLPSPAA